MTSLLTLLVLVAPASFLAVRLVALARPGDEPDLVARSGNLAAVVGVIASIGAGVAVALDGLIESPTWGWRGLGFSIRLDPLSTLMFAMITVLALVIFRYSCTYLEGDERHGRFLGRLAATVAAVEVLVLAGNLALLVVAWIATSMALHQLLVFYRDRRRAVIAARKKFIVARLGDLFLIAAVVVLIVHFGTGNMQQIFDAVASTAQPTWQLDAVGLAALCLAIAAMLKSAQFPTYGWLVEVMDTPTPVSALLHAGILNAGPFLAIRMAYVIDGARVSTTMLIVVGGFTAVFASVTLLTQPSVKVALGYSSAAHMGFMLMICGMGLFPAALLHLVAHSFYKAHAFLSSGGVIDEARAAKVALPRRLGSPTRIVASAAIALAMYLPLAVVFGVRFGGNPVVIAVGGILVMGTTQLIAPALDSAGRLAGTVRAAGLALAVTASFFVLEAGAHHLLSDTVPESVGRDPFQLALIVAVLVAFATVVLLQIIEPTRAAGRRRQRLAIHFRNGLYVNAMFDRAIGALRADAPAVQSSL